MNRQFPNDNTGERKGENGFHKMPKNWYSFCIFGLFTLCLAVCLALSMLSVQHSKLSQYSELELIGTTPLSLELNILMEK